MLQPQSWQKFTQGLAPGRRLRVEHDCGDGRTLIVSNGDAGYSAHCFRCCDDGFIPHPQPSLSERLAALQRVHAAEQALVTSPALPEPRTLDPQEWPDAARVWLYKAGLSNDDITTQGFYYHAPSGRVVLPVMADGCVVYWQARSVDGRQPKYINPHVDRASIVARYGAGPVIVLTEDILSAVRVSRVTEAWSLIGTALHDGVAARLAHDGRPVVCMLDPDPAGQRGNAKAQRLLRSVGVQCETIIPRKDPKLLPTKELSCLLTSSSFWPS